MTVVPTVELRAGYAISRIIKGCWQLSGDHGAVDRDQAVDDLTVFADTGVIAFDCADIYAGVEEMLGHFLSNLRAQRGVDAARQIKVHTKYVPDRDSLRSLTFDEVEQAIDRSLGRLGVERLDLVQFHWWDYGVPGHLEAVAHLERLRGKGKIDLIGVTNFDEPHLGALCQVADVATAQVQYSLLDRRAAGAFAATARAHRVNLLCYGTLAGGFLTDAWLDRPDPGFEFANRSLTKYRLIIEEFGGWGLFQDLLTALRGVADRHDADIAAVALRATLDNADVAAAIVGARYATHLDKTLRAFNIALTDRDHRDLADVLDRSSGPTGAVYGMERDTTGRHGRIMKYNLNKGDDSQLRDRQPDRDAV